MHILSGSVQLEFKILGESRDGIESEITFAMTLSSDNIKAHALQLFKKYHSSTNLYTDMFEPIVKHTARLYFQDNDFPEVKGDLTNKVRSSLTGGLRSTSYQLIHLSVIGGYPSKSLSG
jgi:hypothetical protein